MKEGAPDQGKMIEGLYLCRMCALIAEKQQGVAGDFMPSYAKIVSGRIGDAPQEPAASSPASPPRDVPGLEIVEAEEVQLEELTAESSDVPAARGKTARVFGEGPGEGVPGFEQTVDDAPDGDAVPGDDQSATPPDDATKADEQPVSENAADADIRRGEGAPASADDVPAAEPARVADAVPVLEPDVAPSEASSPEAPAHADETPPAEPPAASDSKPSSVELFGAGVLDRDEDSVETPAKGSPRIVVSEDERKDEPAGAEAVQDGDEASDQERAP
jgi:hypothetical protein